MARTKGALGKKTLALIAEGNIPVKTDKPVIKRIKVAAHYVPYEQSKEDKKGQVILYQTYHAGSQWLIDIFTDRDLTLKGFENNITTLSNAIRFIDADLARL